MCNVEPVAGLETSLYEVLRYPEMIWDEDLQVFAIHDSAMTVIYVGQGDTFWPWDWYGTDRASRLLASPLGSYLLDHLSEAIHWPVRVFYTPAGMSPDELEQRLLDHYKPRFNLLGPSTYRDARQQMPNAQRAAGEGRSARVPSPVDRPSLANGSLRDVSSAWAAGWHWLQHGWTSLVSYRW